MRWFDYMKFSVVMVGAALIAEAQNERCGTSEVYNKLIIEYPGLLQEQLELEQFTQEYSKISKKTEGTVYIIPIVFHILHNYGPENISDEQVKDAVRILNEDFRKLNEDIVSVVPAFQGITADCEIEFRLANKDPDGNCTNGIDRIVTPLTYKGSDAAKLNPWPRSKYLNIWTVKTFDPEKHEGVAGYSYYPSSGSWLQLVDGVILLSHFVGSVGTGDAYRSRVLTHEAGHYLNLPHPWGSTNEPGVNCGDDGVSDTPITRGWKTCDLNHSNVCDSNIQENVQNFMEYSYCDRMFTEGQKTRMRAALASPVGERNNLWTSSNLTATGTSASIPSVCAPNVDFKADVNLVCSGSQVAFSDLSWNGAPSSWLWSFEGGSPSVSTLPGPVVVYNTPGTYNVTLVAGNSGGSGTKTKTGIVTVYSDTATYSSWQYSDSFENDTFPNSDWKTGNNGGITWNRTNSVAATGSLCVMLNNYNTNNEGQVDELLSPSIDLSAISSPALHFMLASAQKNSSSNDQLEIYISSNCGESWTLKYVKKGNKLSTAGVIPSAFYPDASQWRQEVIDLSTSSKKESVHFKFKFTGGDGNNIYIDDINIVGPSDINEIEKSLNFSVFPNPADEAASIGFTLSAKQNISLKIYDLPGKEISVLSNNQELNPGKYNYDLQKNKIISSGIYIVKLKAGQQEFHRKMVVR